MKNANDDLKVSFSQLFFSGFVIFPLAVEALVRGSKNW